MAATVTSPRALSLLLCVALLGSCAMAHRVLQTNNPPPSTPTTPPTAAVNCTPTGGTWPAGDNGTVTVTQYICTATVQNSNGPVCLFFSSPSLSPTAECSATNFDCVYPGQVSATWGTPWPVWNQGPFVFTLQTSMGDPGIILTNVIVSEKCQ